MARVERVNECAGEVAMRAVVQRVLSASVLSEGSEIARMEEGLLAFVGVAPEDETGDAMKLAQRLAHLRVFRDDAGKMNRSVLDVGGTLGIVSQFTLFADTSRGRRPYYGQAADPELAESLLEKLVHACRTLGVHVVTGRFGAAMEVNLVNDGPVTLLFDTKEQ